MLLPLLFLSPILTKKYVGFILSHRTALSAEEEFLTLSAVFKLIFSVKIKFSINNKAQVQI